MTYQQPKSSPPGKGLGPQFMIAISLVILVLCLAGYGVFQVKKHPDVNEGFTNLNNRMQTWWTDRKTRFQNEIQSVKQVVTVADSASVTQPQKVKFEFYHTLPNAELPIKAEQKISQTIAAKAKEEIAPKELAPVAQKPVVTAKVKQQVKKIVAKAKIKKPIKKIYKKKRVAKKHKKLRKKQHYSQKTLNIIKLRKAQKRKKYMARRKKFKHKKLAKRKPIHRVAKKKSRKLKPVVISSVADLEKDMLATIKRTSGRKKI